MGIEKMRLFIGITFDSAALEILDDLGKQLKGISSKGKFTTKENLHLTLVFLGDTDPERISILEEVLCDAMDLTGEEPFFIELSSLGKFQKPGGDIYWVGIKKNKALNLLHSNIEMELRKRGFRFEERSYVPHLTLGRGIVLEHDERLDGLGEKLSGMKAWVSSVSLMWSHRENEVLRYTPIRVCEFCHRGNRASVLRSQADSSE